jgi:hypothetical protein
MQPTQLVQPFQPGPGCFPKGANPNPIAAPWQYPSEWTIQTPEGYRDEFHMYTLTQALTAGQTLTADLVTDTPGNCNFYWLGLGVFLFGGAGVPAVRIRDSEGFVMFNTRVALANDAPFGRGDHITPIFVGHRMVPGSILSFDLRETGGAAAVTCVFYIQGIRRWNEVADYAVNRGGVVGGPQ